MNRRTLAYGALLTGVLTLATESLFDYHPVVLAASFPFAALMFLVMWMGWRPRHGRSSGGGS